MITLSDGRQITPDLHLCSIREYRQLFSVENTQENEDALMARVYGLTVEELLGLSYPDYRLIVKEFFDVARNPVGANPN